MAGLLLYPTDKAAWSRLTRLLTIGKGRAGKGGCNLGWADVAAHAKGLVAILLADRADDDAHRHAAELREAYGGRAHLALIFRRPPDVLVRLHALADLARRTRVRAVATGDVLYHAPEARLLQDVVTAIREKCTADALGFRRERFADRHLTSRAS